MTKLSSSVLIVLSMLGLAATPASEGVLVESTDFRARVQAALSLGRRTDPSAGVALKHGLQDPNPSVRAASAAALMARAGRGAELPEGDLRLALNVETDPSVRSQIRTALASSKAVALPPVSVQLGRVSNRTTTTAPLVERTLRESMEARLAASTRLAYPARTPSPLAFDVVLTKLNAHRSGNELTYVARVEVAMRGGDESLKGAIAGTGEASIETARLRTTVHLAQLQLNAIRTAVDDAVRRAEGAASLLPRGGATKAATP